MQLIGPVFSESILFRAGRMYEKKTGVGLLEPPGFKTPGWRHGAGGSV